MQRDQASQAGGTAPRNDEARATAIATGLLEQKSRQPDCVAASKAEQLRKQVATATAHAALCGIVLHAIEGDDGRPLYVASRWALTRQFETIEAVESWLARVTGKPA